MQEIPLRTAGSLAAGLETISGGAKIYPIPRRIRDIVRLQIVRQVEDHLTPISLKIQRMCEDIFLADATRKVVALPIRTMRRSVTLHNTVVIRYPRIVRPCPPDTEPWRSQQIFPPHLYPVPPPAHARFRGVPEYRGRAGEGTLWRETNPHRRTAPHTPFLDVNSPVFHADPACGTALNSMVYG